MEHVWREIEELREKFEVLREDRTPVGRKYTVEQEANEFAGRLLVPEPRLNVAFDEYAPDAEKLVPNFMQSGSLRDKFSEKVAPRFGVNSQVIAIRLDRDAIWPAA